MQEADGTTRVAVSALGPGIDDRVDERFGRAAFLLTVDVGTLAVEVFDNSANRDALQGAGLGAAEAVAATDARAVITGHLGPKAFGALKTLDIDGYLGAGMTVREAVEAFAEGTLDRLTPSAGHTGLE